MGVPIRRDHLYSLTRNEKQQKENLTHDDTKYIDMRSGKLGPKQK